MSHLRALREDQGQDGFFTVIFVIILPLLLAALGLAVDTSHYWWAEAQLQTAADAAALAGSKDLNSTATGRTAAVSAAASFAVEHKVNGVMLQPSEVLTNTTGRWDFATKTFTTTNVSDPAANAIRVTVQRQNVPSFFAGALSQAAASQTVSASAIAVAGGAGGVGCAAPLAMAACIPTHDSGGNLICPTALSFQNGAKSVGLTIPDGSSPVNGSKAHPYFVDVMSDPDGCSHGVTVGDVLFLQDGNDLTQPSVNAINSATNDGANPKSINVAMVDATCENSGPSYNQSAPVVGFLRMKIVGARWAHDAPAHVAAACPNLGMKNLCIVADCTPIDTPAGGTMQARPERVFLVN